MTIKERLSQVYYIAISVENKREQIERLESLATKMTSTLTDMPKGSSKMQMDDVVCEIVSAQKELKEEVRKLFKEKEEVRKMIESVKGKKCVVLEKRYLLNKTWENISEELGCSVRQAHRVHDKAIDDISKS